jgi:hypothetical protein
LIKQYRELKVKKWAHQKVVTVAMGALGS